MSSSDESGGAVPPAAKTATWRQSDITLIEDAADKVDPSQLEKGPLDLADEEEQGKVHKRSRLAGLRYFIFDVYRRLFTLVFLANVAVFIAVLSSNRKLLALGNAAAANLLACGLARQPLVVNTIFLVVCSIPRSAPLRLRFLAAKVYHYGGVHSGCGVASFIWYIGFVALMSNEYFHPAAGRQPTFSLAPLVMAYIVLILLLSIILAAYPALRFKRHDWFELTHRFTGWTVLAVFVALVVVFCAETSRSIPGQTLGHTLVTFPAFWLLMLAVAAVLQPWLFLRKVPVRPEPLSPHAIRLHFNYTTTSFGKGTQLSRHPLRDWHGFATFPDDADALPTPSGKPESPGFSCLVSKAGDWTSTCIADRPTHLWKRGVLIYGFAYAMRVFNRIVIVTTGSGIGPSLSFLGDENRAQLRVIWQTRAPLRTYGQGVLDLVKRLDSEPIVIDTDRTGRRDMTPLVRRTAREFAAEAVCVISNPMLTRRMVFQLEAEGVPAFGPIFDS